MKIRVELAKADDPLFDQPFVVFSVPRRRHAASVPLATKAQMADIRERCIRSLRAGDPSLTEAGAQQRFEELLEKYVGKLGAQGGPADEKTKDTPRV